MYAATKSLATRIQVDVFGDTVCVVQIPTHTALYTTHCMRGYDARILNYYPKAPLVNREMANLQKIILHVTINEPMFVYKSKKTKTFFSAVNTSTQANS